MSACVRDRFDGSAPGGVARPRSKSYVRGTTSYCKSYRSELAVLDPTTFEIRWELPTADRQSLRRPTTLGGMVYGEVSDRMSAVLDGAPGEDVTVDIDGQIIAVGEHGALVLRDGQVLFLLATA